MELQNLLAMYIHLVCKPFGYLGNLFYILGYAPI